MGQWSPELSRTFDVGWSQAAENDRKKRELANAIMREMISKGQVNAQPGTWSQDPNGQWNVSQQAEGPTMPGEPQPSVTEPAKFTAGEGGVYALNQDTGQAKLLPGPNNKSSIFAYKPNKEPTPREDFKTRAQLETLKQLDEATAKYGDRVGKRNQSLVRKAIGIYKERGMDSEAADLESLINPSQSPADEAAPEDTGPSIISRIGDSIKNLRDKMLGKNAEVGNGDADLRKQATDALRDAGKVRDENTIKKVMERLRTQKKK